MTALYERILSYLKQNEITFETFKHDPVLSIEQVSAILNHPLGHSTKTLALKGGSRIVIATVAGNERFNFKVIANAVGVKRLSMCKEQTLTETLGAERGAMPPFGFSREIPLVVSSSLFTAPNVYFSPGRRDISVKVSGNAFKRVMSDAIAV